MKITTSRLLGLLALLAASAGLTTAQIDRAVLTGTVKDPSGAVIVAADVTIRNVATGVETHTTTTATGGYRFPTLIAGDYELIVAQEGFKTLLQEGINLGVGATVRIDPVLELGATTEQIEVSAAPPILKTDTSELATTVNPKAYLDLPLAMSGGPRNPEQFIFLAPGTTGDTFAAQINGGQSFSKEIVLDGASLEISELKGDNRALTVSVDAISEFKLTTNNYSAEFGRTGGGVSSYQTKSGTNEFHGTAYWYVRNNIFDASGFFQATAPVNRQNEFGGAIGGPIVKNRTFFFFNYNGYQFRSGSRNTTGTVPQPEWLRGDYSSLINQDGSLQQLYDPGTTRQSGNVFVRDPYPNNQIPTSQLSTVAQNAAAFYPAPQFDRLSNNFLSQDSSKTEQDRYATRVDHVLTDNQNLSFSWHWQPRSSNNGPAAALPQPISATRDGDVKAQIGRLSHTWTINPTTINHAIVGAQRNDVLLISPQEGKGWPEQLGLRGVRNGAFPIFRFGGIGGGNIAAGVTPIAQNSEFAEHISNTYEFSDNVTLIRGNHSIKAGYEYRTLEANFISPSRSGNFFFTEAGTGLPGDANTGFPFASFMIGQVHDASLFLNDAVLGGRFSYHGWFVQDDWRVTPNLTLNLGLRYELPIPLSEVHNRTSNFSPTVMNPSAGIPGGQVFAPEEGVTRFWDIYKKSWGPRFGFAYSLGQNTVLRGGYGIFYGAGGLVGGSATRNRATGWSANIFRTTVDQGLTPAFSLDDGFPQDFTPPPFFEADLLNGGGSSWVRPNDARPPYTQNWNLNIQHQLPFEFLIDAAYAGSKGTRLNNGHENFTQLPFSTLTELGRDCLVSPIDSQGACPRTIARPFPTFAGSVAQALRPFPQFTGGVSTPFNQSGNSTYHSFQLKVEKRYSHGLNLLASYTGAKLIDDSGAQLAQISFAAARSRDHFNRRLEKAISQNDVPQRFVLSFNYELPFGPGKARGAKTGVAGKLLEGWQISGIMAYQKGRPLRVIASNTLPIFNGAQLPDRVADSDPRGTRNSFDPATDSWINPAAFRDPAANTIGNAAAYLSDLRSAGSLNEDFSILKRTKVTEGVTVTVRAEAFNIFNRVVFGGPNLNFSDRTSFGIIGGQANNPRQMQLSLRVEF